MDLPLLRNDLEFLGPQKRHGGDRDSAGLDDAQPAGDHRRVIGRTQEHPVARHEPQVIDQHIGDPVGAGEKVTVGPGLVGAPQRDPVAVALLDMDVDQFGRAVDLLGVLEFRIVQQERRPLVLGRQVVPGERVDMGRIA